MKQSYYDHLPRNYFKNIYPQIMKKLTRGENVCVSAIHGVGGKTFLNFFLTLANKEENFDQIIFYDPEVETKGLLEFLKEKIKPRQNLLVVIRQLELIDKRQILLEKLTSLQLANQKKLTYLTITDQTAITQPQNFFGKTTSFFSDKFYLSPFNLQETKLMININNDFFGWDITPEMADRIYQLSGGIPRLIKHIAKDVSELNADLSSPASLFKNPSIAFELSHLANLLIILGRDQLQTLGLIDQDLKVKSLLLKKYLNEFYSQSVKELFPELSDQETKMLSYLYENIDRVLTLEKLQDLVEMSGLKTTPWAIYKLISRLKPKINKNFDIKNVKGRGYLLRKI